MFETSLTGHGWVRPDGTFAPLRAARHDASASAKTAPANEFIVGEENRLPAAAVARLLDRAANESADDDSPRVDPLVLYGPSGVGKTLLCDVIVYGWSVRRPNDQIVRTTAVEFAEQYAAAVEIAAVESFRRRRREADLLVIEDLAKLASKQAAQWELLHALDALERAGGHVVVTLDEPPSKCDALLPGLVGRLTGGTTVAVAAASVASRRAILARVVASRDWNVDPKALDLLAADVETTVPEMIGTLTTLEAAARHEGARLDACFVRRRFDQRSRRDAPTLKAIAEQTARNFGLTAAKLKSGSRLRTVVAARDSAVFLARRLTNKSLQEIGEFFGGRDHTTILHSCRKVQTAVEQDPAARDALDAIRRRLLKT